MRQTAIVGAKPHTAVRSSTGAYHDIATEGTVGGSEMMVPRDTENGADLSEVSNCRCWVTFS